MKKETLMCKLFNFSVATYYKRKRENNLAIKFIEKYFSNEELIELIETQSIKKLDRLDFIEKEENILTEIINNFDYYQKTLLVHIITKFKTQNFHQNINSFIQYYGLAFFIKELNYFPESFNDLNNNFAKITKEQMYDQENFLKCSQGKEVIDMIHELSKINIDILLMDYRDLINISEEFVKIPIDLFKA